MLVLATTASKLKCKLAAAGTAANFFGVYADGSSSGVFTPGSTQLASNGTSDVTVVAAPSSGYQRQVKHCYVYNGEASAITVTTSYEDISTTRILSVVTIQPGASADTLSLEAATGAQLGVANTWPALQTFSGGVAGVETFSVGVASFMIGLRNKFINGDTQVDQRNSGAAQTVTAAAALAYCVDRWYAYCTGANVTGQRVAGTAPNKYNYRFTGAASVTKIGFAQRIKASNSQDLAGQTATLSVDLANSLLTTVTWVAYYATSEDAFGTLASPTRTQIATGTFTVTSTLTRYSTQISIPAAATTGVEVELSVGAQTSGTWTIGRAQLEAGSIATPYEVRPLEFEELLCSYYLPSLKSPSTNNAMPGFGYCNSTTSARVSIPFPLARVNPTGISISAASHFSVQSNGANYAASAISFNTSSRYGAWVEFTLPTVTQNAIAMPFFNNASASMLFTGCEL